MGSFSWLKADKLTNVANIVDDKPFKCLIPAEFGGGFVRDSYQDYGYLGVKPDGTPKYDMYELLAFWNADESILSQLNWPGKDEGAPRPHDEGDRRVHRQEQERRHRHWLLR